MYVVSFIPDYSVVPVCSVMNGYDLAKLYGFTDCREVDIKHVWKFMPDGDLAEVNIHGSYEAPYNWLIIENRCGNEVARYEWPEH